MLNRTALRLNGRRSRVNSTPSPSGVLSGSAFPAVAWFLSRCAKALNGHRPTRLSGGCPLAAFLCRPQRFRRAWITCITDGLASKLVLLYPGYLSCVPSGFTALETENAAIALWYITYSILSLLEAPFLQDPLRSATFLSWHPWKLMILRSLSADCEQIAEDAKKP